MAYKLHNTLEMKNHINRQSIIKSKYPGLESWERFVVNKSILFSSDETEFRYTELRSDISGNILNFIDLGKALVSSTSRFGEQLLMYYNNKLTLSNEMANMVSMEPCATTSSTNGTALPEDESKNQLLCAIAVKVE